MNFRKLGTIFVVVATLALLMSGMVGLVGCGDGDGDSNGWVPSSPGTSDTPGGGIEYIEVDIGKMAADYAVSVSMADMLYKDKNIKIVGQVVATSESEDLRVVLGVPDEPEAVVVIYLASLAGSSGSAGGLLEVSGKCTGMGTALEDNGLVRIQDCITTVQ